jgi:hypothetical protein
MSKSTFNWSADAKTYVQQNFKSISAVEGFRSSDKSPFVLFRAIRKDNGREQIVSIGKSIAALPTPAVAKSWAADANISELVEVDDFTGEVKTVLIFHLRGERANETDATDDFM